MICDTTTRRRILSARAAWARRRAKSGSHPCKPKANDGSSTAAKLNAPHPALVTGAEWDFFSATLSGPARGVINETVGRGADVKWAGPDTIRRGGACPGSAGPGKARTGARR